MGEAINFDGENAGPVREFFVANARYWVEEFHLDGLRLDATQSIHDSSAEHVLAASTRRVRETAGGRRTLVIAKNEPQRTELLRPAGQGGYALDALWDDDFHHSTVVALTGRNEAYYTDYRGTPQELISTAKRGFLYQGQYYGWQKKGRGAPTRDTKPAAFVNYMQNHDQVANSLRGERIHRLTSPGRHRALTALLLLSPGTPMLFQGQEFSASTPFLFFADHLPELAEAVRAGRADFLRQYRSLADFDARQYFADPADPATFERCRLDLGERQCHAEAYALHRDLLALRRSEAAFRAQQPAGVDGAVLDAEAFVLRFFGDVEDDRLLVVNLGRDLHLHALPEPLLAPPEGTVWRVIWYSEDVRYGGGMARPETRADWRIPAEIAVVLAPASLKRAPNG